MPQSESIAEALGRAFGQRPDLPLAAVYLFGSEASGTAHRESDIDVALLLSSDAPRGAAEVFRLRVQVGSDLISVLHRNEIDVVVLDQVSPLFGRAIINKGQRVYCRDPERDHAFRRDVQLLAADLQPFVERGRRRALEQILR